MDGLRRSTFVTHIELMRLSPTHVRLQVDLGRTGASTVSAKAKTFLYPYTNLIRLKR